jgi:predicted enzyme related to lactoylglutathione lyase
LTSDVAASRDFYGQLFGWTFEESGGYTVISNNGSSIGGMVQLRETSAKQGASRWLCSLSVDDVDRSAELVANRSGKVHEGPLELVNRGRGALVSDPQGAQLLLLHTSGGDPEDEEPSTGSWLWHELWSNQPQASLAFYQELAGYDFTGDAGDYLILTREGQWRAGIRFVDNSELEMRWVPVVRVDDTAAIAERARQLGGKVPVGPRPTEDGGSVALLADPTGALLIIQHWTAPSAGQEK